MNKLGVVVIGRNEGARLQRCLRSIGENHPIVYVDSGSTDGSVLIAKSMGASVVMLDVAKPFTAARARNAGLRALLVQNPDIQLVQFVDGDCELCRDWLRRAMDWLAEKPGYAVVCGRRRERYPEASVYNALSDIEWATPAGDAKACGGDALMRVNALQHAGGFRDDLIAGEEPELCVRLRKRGWNIRRLDAEMTLHDADMHRFGQWWRRAKRAGYAYANGAWLHGGGAEHHWVRETVRSGIWVFFIPALLLSAMLLFGVNALWGFLLYPLNTVRVALKHRQLGKMTWPYAFFMTLARLPETIGIVSFVWDLLLRRRATLIEYKASP